MSDKRKVYIVYDANDGEVSRVFDNREASEKWIAKGHKEGWLYDEDCYIFEQEIHSDIS